MIELPYPPSANSIWRNIVVGGRARTVLSKEGREYRARVHAQLAGSVPLEGPVAVMLRVYRPRRIGDIDNTAKATLDAVKGFLFVDDSQVVSLHMERYDDKKRPRVEVQVTRSFDTAAAKPTPNQRRGRVPTPNVVRPKP